MVKRVLCVFIAITLVLTTGCSIIASDDTESSSSKFSFKVERSANISPNWIVKDIEIKLGAGEELPILLKLAVGNQISGEFYLEEGDNVGFNIAANTVFYIPSISTDGMTSDRFSFIATTEQGTTYVMTFTNPETNSKSDSNIKISLHLTYPDTASLFIPVGTE